MMQSLLIGLLLAGIGLPACHQSAISEIGACEEAKVVDSLTAAQTTWPENWSRHWPILEQGAWGFENFEPINLAEDARNPESGEPGIRVYYPAGSASPQAARRYNAPTGGGQFYTTLDTPPQDHLCLSYWVRFSPDFDFVKGGKLPGLYGGSATSGGEQPDGHNGFSTRLMWRTGGVGEVYAYLPNEENYGTSIGRGNWQFQPGRWYHLKQTVTLNQPGQADGRIRLWVDGQPVIDQTEIRFRDTPNLQIEGIFFSTFFGGGDLSWATPEDVYIEFAGFQITEEIERD